MNRLFKCSKYRPNGNRLVMDFGNSRIYTSQLTFKHSNINYYYIEFRVDDWAFTKYNKKDTDVYVKVKDLKPSRRNCINSEIRIAKKIAVWHMFKVQNFIDIRNVYRAYSVEYKCNYYDKPSELYDYKITRAKNNIAYIIDNSDCENKPIKERLLYRLIF